MGFSEEFVNFLLHEAHADARQQQQQNALSSPAQQFPESTPTAALRPAKPLIITSTTRSASTYRESGNGGGSGAGAINTSAAVLRGDVMDNPGSERPSVSSSIAPTPTATPSTHIRQSSSGSNSSSSNVTLPMASSRDGVGSAAAASSGNFLSSTTAEDLLLAPTTPPRALSHGISVGTPLSVSFEALVGEGSVDHPSVRAAGSIN